METRSQSQLAGYLAAHAHISGAGSRDAREDFQQGAFAGAVAADDAERLSARDREAYILQRASLREMALHPEGAQEEFLHDRALAIVDPVGLGNPLDHDRG